MKKLLTNNVSLKLLSLLFAVIFWLIVVNIDDPEVSRTIQGISVTVLDEEVITGNNQVYNIVSGEEVTITVKGPRSEVDRMTKDDFVAEAPFSEKSNVDAVPIYVTFRNSKYEKDCEITQKTMSMRLEIENIVTKSYEIGINHTSNLTSAYYLGKENIEPKSVTISAPESVINQIENVMVDVDLSSHTEDFSVPLNIKCITETGTNISYNAQNVSIDSSTVTYSANVYAVREVPLEFGTKGTVADGYELVDVMSEKSTIKIAGPNADKIDSIVIPSELINVAGANSDVTVDVDILAQLPSGVFLYNDGDATMKVTAYIEQLVTNTYRLPVSEIDKNNIPEGYTAEITDQSVNISVVGLQKNQESFSLDGLNAYVDLKNTVEGNNEVILKLTLPDGLRVLTEVRVNVLLTKNVDDTYTTTSDMTSDSQEETT
jgi:YbbR domain-containing protein